MLKSIYLEPLRMLFAESGFKVYRNSFSNFYNFSVIGNYFTAKTSKKSSQQKNNKE